MLLISLGARNESPHDATSSAVSAPAEHHITHASWYGPGFFGHVTKSGRLFTKEDLLVAHRTYPIGTKLVVTNLQNHLSIVVSVEDRGPYHHPGRDLDLLYAAAKQLGMINQGVVLVSYTIYSNKPPS